MGRKKFFDLTPENNISLDTLNTYKEAIDESFKNNKIKNVAISGSYGSGKSSILESYKKIKKTKKFLNISLIHFEKSNKNRKENNKNLLVTLEGKILNQLLHQIPIENIPQTYFKTKKIVTDRDLKFSSFFIVLFTMSFLHFFFFEKWCNHISKMNLTNILYYFKIILEFSIKRISTLISGTLIISLFTVFIYKLLKFQRNRNFLKKLSIQGNEIEIAENNNDSYFDKYLNEVLYLFEKSDVDAIVFEDIDRYDTSEIFERLKEINKLVNNHLEKDNKVLKFFYLLKDDIFTSKDRIKFFDIIIPVIPVINSSNSYEQILKHFDKEYLKEIKLDLHFLQDISLYIDDMRLLKNVYNEFNIYYENLKYTEIKSNKLFGIILYKNLFPKDFCSLQLNQGFIYNLFSQKENIQKNEIEKIKEDIKKLEQKLEEQKLYSLENLKELEFLKEVCQNRFEDIYYYNEEKDKIETWLNKYPSQVKKFEEPEEKILAELKKKEKQKSKLETQSFKNIITNENINDIFNLKFIENIKNTEIFNEVKENFYFNLLKYLVKNGYLDETYQDYITYFYPNSLSIEDKIFMRAVLDGDKKRCNYDYKLKNPNIVIKRLKYNYFEEEEILNFDILNSLLEMNGEKIKLHNFFRQLKEPKNYIFIERFFYLGKYRKNFTRQLNTFWNECFENIESYLSDEMIYSYSLYTLCFSDIELLRDINKNNFLKEYIENNENFLKVEEKDIEDIKETAIINVISRNFKALNIKFKRLNYNISNKWLFKEIYENSMYDLNFYNISHILEKLFKYPKEEIVHSNYTLINKDKTAKLCGYIEDNIAEYSKSILNNCDKKIDDTEDIIIKFLNNNKIEKEDKQKYIEFLSKEISEISKIKDQKLWNKLLIREKVSYSEKNIIKYYNEKELNKILIHFINLGKKELSFQDASEDFFLKVHSCNKLKNKIYKNIIKTFGWHFENGDFSKKISKEKMDILIELNIIKMTEENLNIIRKNYISNLKYFIKFNIKKYSELINSNLFSQEELLFILSTDNIEDSIKLKLLKFSNDEISIINKNYSVNIQKYILKNNFNSQDFLVIIKKFNKYDETIKNIIFDMIIDDTYQLHNHLSDLSDELIKKILKSNKIYTNEKEEILLKIVDIPKKIKNFENYLECMNLKEFKDIFKKNKTLYVKVSDFNKNLLEKLLKKKYIENYYEKIGELYKVITKKDKFNNSNIKKQTL